MERGRVPCAHEDVAAGGSCAARRGLRGRGYARAGAAAGGVRRYTLGSRAQ
jgi:hypothetical protein